MNMRQHMWCGCLTIVVRNRLGNIFISFVFFEFVSAFLHSFLFLFWKICFLFVVQYILFVLIYLIFIFIFILHKPQNNRQSRSYSLFCYRCCCYGCCYSIQFISLLFSLFFLLFTVMRLMLMLFQFFFVHSFRVMLIILCRCESINYTRRTFDSFVFWMCSFASLLDIEKHNSNKTSKLSYHGKINQTR